MSSVSKLFRKPRAKPKENCAMSCVVCPPLFNMEFHDNSLGAGQCFAAR